MPAAPAHGYFSNFSRLRNLIDFGRNVNKQFTVHGDIGVFLSGSYKRDTSVSMPSSSFSLALSSGIAAPGIHEPYQSTIDRDGIGQVPAPTAAKSAVQTQKARSCPWPQTTTVPSRIPNQLRHGCRQIGAQLLHLCSFRRSRHEPRLLRTD